VENNVPVGYGVIATANGHHLVVFVVLDLSRQGYGGFPLDLPCGAEVLVDSRRFPSM
jgi:hypothetical protein